MTTQSIRVGVVGVGYLGAIHAQIYAAMAGVELVGVADIDVQAAARVAKECGCSAYSEPGALLDKVCLLYTSPSPRDQRGSRMPSSA